MRTPWTADQRAAIARAAREAFDGQAHDLAAVAEQCGAKAITLGDAADAAYHAMRRDEALPADFYAAANVGAAFDAIKDGLRPLGFRRGWYRF